MSQSNYAKQYAVQITSTFGKVGSGVLIKVDEETCYLATAKHNFTNSSRDESWRDVANCTLTEQFSEIKVSKNEKDVCNIIDIKYEWDDLIIFEIINHEHITDNLALISILNDNLGDTETFFIQGYSAENADGIIPNLHSQHHVEGQNYIYTIQDNQSIRKTHIRGYSGSGVFIKYREKFYLVGIALGRIDDGSTFHIFNLAKILDELPKKRKFIHIVKDVTDILEAPHMYTTMIRRNQDTFLSKKAIRLFGKKHKYRDLINKTDKLEILSNYIENNNSLKELEDDYFTELADLYLLGTFISKKQGRERKATEYFEKAKFFRPDYIRYTNEVKEVDSKKELLDKGKIAYMNKEYQEAKINLTKSLKLDNLEISDKLFVYKNLVSIGKIEKNNSETMEAYEQLSMLYSKEDSLEQVKIYYELSELTVEDTYKLDLLRKGLAKIKDESSTDFLEIKYKILKSMDKVVKEKNTIKSDIENILKKISHLAPKYRDELNNIEQNKLEKKLCLKKVEEQKNTFIEKKEKVEKNIKRGSVMAIIILVILLTIFAILIKINKLIILGTFIAFVIGLLFYLYKPLRG